VTPVRTLSPLINVVCPTRTPGTSVMAFHRPGSNSPGAIPRVPGARAWRFRGGGCEGEEANEQGAGFHRERGSILSVPL
jgi:hypothetical protein